MRADSLHVFYRLSDAAQSGIDGRPSLKSKPAFVNNRACLSNFIAVFGRTRLSVLADRVSDATYRARPVVAVTIASGHFHIRLGRVRYQGPGWKMAAANVLEAR